MQSDFRVSYRSFHVYQRFSSRAWLFLPAVEEGFLPGFEFVCTRRHCIGKLYELAAERDLTKEQHKGVQPGRRKGGEAGTC